METTGVTLNDAWCLTYLSASTLHI